MDKIDLTKNNISRSDSSISGDDTQRGRGWAITIFRFWGLCNATIFGKFLNKVASNCNKIEKYTKIGRGSQGAGTEMRCGEVGRRHSQAISGGAAPQSRFVKLKIFFRKFNLRHFLRNFPKKFAAPPAPHYILEFYRVWNSLATYVFVRCVLSSIFFTFNLELLHILCIIIPLKSRAPTLVPVEILGSRHSHDFDDLQLNSQKQTTTKHKYLSIKFRVPLEGDLSFDHFSRNNTV